MSAHDFVLVAPLFPRNLAPQIIFRALLAAKFRSKRKVPILSAKEVPALANVRALLSPAQLNISHNEPQ
jgi:hypothetical protein